MGKRPHGVVLDGKFLRHERLARGMNQQSFAESVLGIDTKTLANAEKCKRVLPRTARHIASKLNVSISTLTGSHEDSLMAMPHLHAKLQLLISSKNYDETQTIDLLDKLIQLFNMDQRIRVRKLALELEIESTSDGSVHLHCNCNFACLIALQTFDYLAKKRWKWPNKKFSFLDTLRPANLHSSSSLSEELPIDIYSIANREERRILNNFAMIDTMIRQSNHSIGQGILSEDGFVLDQPPMFPDYQWFNDALIEMDKPYIPSDDDIDQSPKT